MGEGLAPNPAVGGRGRLRPALGVALGLAGALALVCGAACASVSKAELETRLRALDKNRAVVDLDRIPLTVDLGDGPLELELVLHHAPGPPAADAAGRRPVVLVHGTPSTLFSWSEVIHGTPEFDGLAARRDVYAIEVIGHGIAPGDAAPYGFATCARFTAAALGALGIGEAHLVGSSYGGEFAWRAALDEPGRVASLVLVDSSGIRRRDGDWLPEEVEMRENALAKIGWLLNSRDRISTALGPHFDGIPPDRVEEFFLVCENAHNWKAMVDLARDENGDREDELSRLEVPTLVLWGEDDVAYPIDHYGRRFAEAIPDARLLSLPDTGHYPHEQRPSEFVRALNEFFDACESGVVIGWSAVLLLLSASLAGDPRDFELRPTRLDWAELSPRVFDRRWTLPEPRTAPGTDLLAEIRALLDLRFDVRDGAGRQHLCFGDLARTARARAEAGAEVEPWLEELLARAPAPLRERSEQVMELLLDDRLHSDRWNPSKDHARDGLLLAEAWDLGLEPTGPWAGLDVDPAVEQAAALIHADLRSIKAAENDYRVYPENVGAEYEEIYPVAGTYRTGEDAAGRPFSSLVLHFTCDLPFPFSSYTTRLCILNRCDASGLLRSDIYSTSADFHWLAGRDVFLPVTTADGEWVAFLLVRYFGFDLDGVPDGGGHRRDALRGSLGNLERRAEALWRERGSHAEPENDPAFLKELRVLGRR